MGHHSLYGTAFRKHLASSGTGSLTTARQCPAKELPRWATAAHHREFSCAYRWRPCSRFEHATWPVARCPAALTMRTALAVHAVALLALAALVAAHSPASAHASDGGLWQLQRQEERWRLEREEDTYTAARQLQQLPSGAAGGPAAALAQPPSGSAGAATAMAPAAAASPAVAAALSPGQDLPPGSEFVLIAGTDLLQGSIHHAVSCADALPCNVARAPPVACQSPTHPLHGAAAQDSTVIYEILRPGELPNGTTASFQFYRYRVSLHQAMSQVTSTFARHALCTSPHRPGDT